MTPITVILLCLLALLVLLLLVGALKLIVGAVLATVNPLIGAFYTFFFATLAGKALSKAILTTASRLDSRSQWTFGQQNRNLPH